MKNDAESGGRHVSDWSQWTVEHMWLVLQGENPERTARHGGAWYDVMDACARHRDRLRAFRDQLTQRWTGAAADAYVAKLDQLIRGLDETTEAAFNTYRALTTMADAVAVAREQMAPLYAQWQRYQQEERDYRDQWWVMQVIRDNPVTHEEREAINRPARAIMNVASDAIFESYLRMTPAPPYDFRGFHEGAETIDDTGAGYLRPPPIPPLKQILDTVPPLPASVPTRPAPILNGTPSPIELVTTGPLPSAVPASGVPSARSGMPNNGVLPLPPTPIGSQSTASSRGRGPVGGPQSIGGSAKSGSGAATPITPPSVFGARPTATGWAPTAPMTMSPGGRRVSPIGGVIGAPPTSNRRSRRGDGDQWTYHDDEDPFIVDTTNAVSPVLEPNPEPPFIDPGPAIGLKR